MTHVNGSTSQYHYLSILCVFSRKSCPRQLSASATWYHSFHVFSSRHKLLFPLELQALKCLGITCFLLALCFIRNLEARCCSVSWWLTQSHTGQRQSCYFCTYYDMILLKHWCNTETWSWINVESRCNVDQLHLQLSKQFVGLDFKPSSYKVHSASKEVFKAWIVDICINLLTPELNPSAQRCLTICFTWEFASWTVYFVNICVKNQQMQQLFIQFINCVW
jgi:hypothetical protein